MSEQDRIKVVIDSYGGILPTSEMMYIINILNETTVAITFFEKADSIYSEQGRKANGEVFSNILYGMIHTGNLSRYFFASPGGRSGFKDLSRARAEKLKAAFGISDASPLANRALRDSLEHFDERIDEFFIAYDGGPMIGSPVLTTIGNKPEEFASVAVALDMDKRKCVVFGKLYEFDSLLDELKRVKASAENMMKAGFRLKKP